MKVLLLSTDPGVPVRGHKGASVHVRELATALSRLGIEVAIASPRTEPAGDRIDAAIALRRIPPVVSSGSEAELKGALEAQRVAVLELARHLEIEAIYERYALFSDAGVVAAAGLGIPHVLEVNAPLREEARRFRTLPHPELAEEIERSVYRSSARVFAVSSALKRWLAANGVEPDRVDVVPNAIAPEKFSPRRIRSDAAFVVGFCGSLKTWHGIEVLVEACGTAFAEESSLRLEVVGSGPLEHRLRETGLPAGRFAAHAAVPHARAIERMRGWDVGVAPYLPQDDFYFSPLKVLEYMAAGLCPVVSALGDLPALLGEGDRGVLVPAGDADALAEELVELARDRDRAVALGSRARVYVLQAHTWELTARLVLEALHRNLGELAA